MRVLLQAVPRGDFNLKAEVETVRREKARTFRLDKRNRWKHNQYWGWIWLSSGRGGILCAEICAKGDDFPTKILEAFVGFLMRHLQGKILSVHLTL